MKAKRKNGMITEVKTEESRGLYLTEAKDSEERVIVYTAIHLHTPNGI